MPAQRREGLDRSAGETTGTLDLPGARLHYRTGGSGEPVVLVHGLALDLRMWDDQVPALAGIGTVVRYDVRGFGLSVADETTEYTHAGDLWQAGRPPRLRSRSPRRSVHGWPDRPGVRPGRTAAGHVPGAARRGRGWGALGSGLRPRHAAHRRGAAPRWTRGSQGGLAPASLLRAGPTPTEGRCPPAADGRRLLGPDLDRPRPPRTSPHDAELAGRPHRAHHRRGRRA